MLGGDAEKILPQVPAEPRGDPAEPAHRALRHALAPPQLVAREPAVGLAGVAAGMFAGLVPGSNPVQFAVAAMLAVAFRVNLPVAVAVTLYTNPFHHRAAVPDRVTASAPCSCRATARLSSIPPEFDWSNLGAWLRASLEWMLSLGKPLAAGLVVLAVGLAIAGYVIVQARLARRTWCSPGGGARRDVREWARGNCALQIGDRSTKLATNLGDYAGLDSVKPCVIAQVRRHVSGGNGQTWWMPA